MIDLAHIEQRTLATDPFEWAFADGLFTPADSQALMETFPRDHFKTVRGYDGEKGYEYEARALVDMGADAPAHVESLSPVWRQLALDLLSPAYRQAIARLTARDLSALPMEVNVFHYGPGAWLGPHVDLKEKILTQIFYFNDSWDEKDGGSLSILRSAKLTDSVASVMPIVGNSVVLVRSERSWHTVAPVAKGCRRSRRSLTVTFYAPGSMSTMWPPGDTTPLHNYDETAGSRGAAGFVWPRIQSIARMVSLSRRGR